MRRVVTIALAATAAFFVSCTRDEPTSPVREIHPSFAMTGTDTSHAYAKRDSLAADSLAAVLKREKHLTGASQQTLTKLATSLRQAPAVQDTTTVVVVQDPPPAPPPPPAPSCTLVSDWNARSTSALAKPGYLQSAIDPDFGTTITRISGDVGATIPTVGGTWPSTVKQNYPKDPVWTADQRLMVLKTGFTNSAALFLDGTTYAPLFFRSGPSGGGEWRLHPTLADVAVVIRADGTVSHWNVRTNTMTTKVAAMSGYTSNTFGPYEGNLSRDGRYLVAQATRSSDGHIVARVIDVDGGTQLTVIDLTAAGIASLDWVTISTSGNYVVAFDNSQYTRVWTRAGALRWYWTDMKFGHYDLGLDASGNDVAFGAEASGSYAKRFITRRLDTGAITVLSPATSYNWHASTRGPTGEGFAATNDLVGPVAGELYSITFGGAVARWAHHRAVGDTYNDDPHPVPSPDGKRIVFSSNWGTAGGAIQTYIVSCP